MSAASQGGEGGGSPGRAGGGPEAVWAELFTTVSSLQETVELSLQAFTPDPAFGEQKVRCRWSIVDQPYLPLQRSKLATLSAAQAVSATTKKRLLVKAVHGLQKGKEGMQVRRLTAF